MINLSVLLITQFQILKKNLKAITVISFLLGLNIVYSQSNSQEIDTLNFVEQDKKPLLLDNIKYDATDSIIIDQKNNKIILYNNAKIIYGDIELTSGLIILDYKENIVNAGRIADSKGNLSQYPTFKQGGNIVNPDSIKYNFDNQKALIWNSKSEDNGMNILSTLTKKQNDSVYYLKDGKVTTGGNLMGDETEEADYFFKIRKGKLVPGGNIVTGFTNLFVKNVPTPIGLPFAYFPSQQTKESGFIIPNISDSNERGYSLQNGGYYIPLSEYFDLTVLADYYTNGSYGLNVSSQYKKNYKYSGNFSVRYENLINGERGLPGYGKSTVYNIRWSHSKDSKASPNSSFSASVNFGSSDYFRQSVNQLNTANFLNNNLSSSISYSKSFPGSAGVRLSMTANMSQNTQSKEVNLTLPTLTLNTARFYPFERKGKSKKGILQNINIQYSSKLENRAIFADDLLLKKGMFENAKSFNQPLDNWNVSKVTNMKNMFKNAKKFNQNISNWIVSSEKTDIDNIFDNVDIQNTNKFTTVEQIDCNKERGEYTDRNRTEETTGSCTPCTENQWVNNNVCTTYTYTSDKLTCNGSNGKFTPGTATSDQKCILCMSNQWVKPRQYNWQNDQCYDITDATLLVNLLPEFTLEDSYMACVDVNGTELIGPTVMLIDLPDNQYTFEWINPAGDLEAITAAHTPLMGGIYTAVATDILTGCRREVTTEVIPSSPAIVEAVVTTLAFAEEHVIEANAVGSGDYEYRLDDGPWQLDGTFTDVSPGEHIVTVRDLNGCGIGTKSVLVIDYPRFFTPNGDGYNDTWQIIGIDTRPLSTIYIFDRYGKLLKQLSPLSEGWDGTFNGKPLPATDYWFTVKYEEPGTEIIKTFRAHFSLKR